jgi:1-acyl-sn-glycerol-3-phosphate acyltransferase
VDWSDPGTFAEGLLALLGPEAQHRTPGLLEDVREIVAAAGPHEMERLFERIRDTGESWGYHAAHPVARAVSRLVMRSMLDAGSEVVHAEALAAASGRPAILVGNHLSFADANVLEFLIAEAGGPELAERLVVVAGPKVFTTPLRRLASLSFGTIKTPQSAALASGEAVMSAREVARTASRTLRVARERVAGGGALLVFVEGTRSRTGAMQRALAGVARYLDPAEAVVIPFGLTGSERLTPIDSNEQFQRARVAIRIGPPVEATDLVERCARRRALIMDTLGFMIADCLPPEMRGVYGGADGRLADARRLSAELSRLRKSPDA